MTIILENLPIILCFIFGICLMIVELFMPGFGLAGIIGLILSSVAVALTYQLYGITMALLVTLFVIIITVFCIAKAIRSYKKGRLSKTSMVLNEEETVENGYVAIKNNTQYIGKTGITHTVLRPTGIIIVDGEKINAQSEGDYIEKNTPVVVTKIDGLSLIVKQTIK